MGDMRRGAECNQFLVKAVLLRCTRAGKNKTSKVRFPTQERLVTSFGLDLTNWSGSMSKELIARHDLERIAMQEIRALPGGEHVTDVSIEYQRDRVLRTNWTMRVITGEGANMERIQYAINATRHRLEHRYDLRSES
jgi:hypothetical protein